MESDRDTHTETTGPLQSPRRDHERQRHTEVKGERQRAMQTRRVGCYRDREKVE